MTTVLLSLAIVVCWGSWIPLAQAVPGIAQSTRTLYATAGNLVFAAVALVVGGHRSQQRRARHPLAGVAAAAAAGSVDELDVACGGGAGDRRDRGRRDGGRAAPSAPRDGGPDDRDDSDDSNDIDNAWQAPEVFLKDRLGLKFTHGICPDCIRQLYDL